MPTLKVDGIEVEVPADATVLQACEAAAWPSQGLIKHFRPEMQRRLTERAGGDFAPMQAAAE